MTLVRPRRPRGLRRPRTGVLVLAASALLAACGGGDVATDDGPLRVAAASDLRPVLDQLEQAFEDRADAEVVFSVGSSGQLAQQLIEGAPMELFLSAHVDLVDLVRAEDVGDPASQATYAFGRLALWSPEETWGGWDDLAALADDLEAGRISSLAIANPDHAPYGRAAQQALQAADVWASVEPHLVLAESVTDAHRMAASGNVDAAITSLPHAAVDAEERGTTGADGWWLTLDPDLYAPLQQDLLVTTEDPARAALAQRFADLLLGADGRTLLEDLGWEVPDDDAGSG